MAYPTICPSCLDGRHDECQTDEEFAKASKQYPGLVGGWFCVCAHGGEENEFQRSVREGMEVEK